MICLKCGRETNQTFCESCRETMAKYPVKPGAVVVLPKERKVSAKQAPVLITSASLERIIEVQGRYLRRFSIALIVLVALVIVLSIQYFRLLQGNDARPVGQNYSTITSTPAEKSGGK